MPGELTFCDDCGNAYDGAKHDCPICAVADRLDALIHDVDDQQEIISELYQSIPNDD